MAAAVANPREGAGSETDNARQEARVLIATARRVLLAGNKHQEAQAIRSMGEQLYGPEAMEALRHHVAFPEHRSQYAGEDGLNGRTASPTERPKTFTTSGFPPLDALQHMARAYVRFLALRRWEFMEIVEATCLRVWGPDKWWDYVQRVYLISNGG